MRGACLGSSAKHFGGRSLCRTHKILVVKDVRCGPEVSKSYALAAAFAAWEVIAADEDHLVCAAVPAVMNDLVYARRRNRITGLIQFAVALWTYESRASRRTLLMRVHRSYTPLPH